MFKADIEKNDPFYRFISFWAGLLIWTFYAYSSISAYQQWPYWMWMYFLEPPSFSTWGWLFVYIVLYGVPFLAGYLIGSHGRANSWISLCFAFVFSVATPFILIASMWDRYSIFADSMDYAQGGVNVWSNTGYVQHLGVGISIITAYSFICFFLSRRYRARALESGKIQNQLLHPAKKRTLQRIAEAVLPEAPGVRKVTGKDMPHLAETISVHLADLDFLSRTVIRLAIDFVNISPFFYKFKPLRLENLPIEEQIEILERIENSKIFELKISLKLIRMFIYQFYYEDQRVLDDIDYIGESRGYFGGSFDG